jgi:hypothetical protein
MNDSLLECWRKQALLLIETKDDSQQAPALSCALNDRGCRVPLLDSNHNVLILFFS